MLEVRGQAMDFEVAGAEDNAAPVEYISNEEYDKKEGTVRDYLRKNKLGKFSEDYQAKKLQEEKEQLDLYESLKNRVGALPCHSCCVLLLFLNKYFEFQKTYATDFICSNYYTVLYRMLYSSVRKERNLYLPARQHG